MKRTDLDFIIQVLKCYCTSSMNPDQIAPGSSLIMVYFVCSDSLLPSQYFLVMSGWVFLG